MTTTIEIAAARIMECDTEDIEKESYDHYGMDVYSYGGEEYAIGTEEESDEAVKQYIRDSLWSFRASFVLQHSRVAESQKIIKAIEEMQGKLAEDCNEIIYALIEDIDEFTRDAIDEDGRGTFLSPYDSKEKEVEINGITLYCYRLN